MRWAIRLNRERKKPWCMIRCYWTETKLSIRKSGVSTNFSIRLLQSSPICLAGCWHCMIGHGCSAYRLFLRWQHVQPVRVFHAMWSQMIDSLSVIRGKPRIAFLIVSFQLLEAFLVSMFFYLQIHWKHLGMNELQIMTIFSIASAVSDASASSYPRANSLALFSETVTLLRSAL